LARARKLFAAPTRLAQAQRRGMARDFSWRTAARAYEQLYLDTL
jgi:glycogen synthase